MLEPAWFDRAAATVNALPWAPRAPRMGFEARLDPRDKVGVSSCPSFGLSFNKSHSTHTNPCNVPRTPFLHRR